MPDIFSPAHAVAFAIVLAVMLLRHFYVKPAIPTTWLQRQHFRDVMLMLFQGIVLIGFAISSLISERAGHILGEALVKALLVLLMLGIVTNLGKSVRARLAR